MIDSKEVNEKEKEELKNERKKRWKFKNVRQISTKESNESCSDERTPRKNQWDEKKKKRRRSKTEKILPRKDWSRTLAAWTMF